MTLRFLAVFLLSCLLCLPASGALGIDVNSSSDSASGTVIKSPLISMSADRELVVAFVAADAVEANNTTVLTVAGGNLTWELVVRTNSQRGTAEIWRAFAPVRLTDMSVTATLSQSVASSMTVISFTGVNTSGTNGSGAIGATGSASSGSGAPTASLVTTHDNSWVFGVGNDFDNAIPRVVAQGQSLVHQYLAPVNDTYWVQMLDGPTATAGTVVAVSDTAPTSDRYNLSICEVVAATSATAPLISGVTAVPGSTSAQINWTTDVPSTSRVDFGISPSALTSAVTDETLVTSHSLGLTGLVAGTTYFYRVTSADASNNTSVTPPITSAALSFSTVSSVSNISGTISPASSGSGVTVALSGAATWSATTDGSGYYVFPGRGNGTYTVTPAKAGFVFSPASQTVTVSGADVANVNFSVTAMPTTAPLISGVTVVPGAGSAQISWSTNTATNSRVDFGTSATALTSNTSDPKLVTVHTLNLTGLAGNTTYYYRITSTDASGQSSVYPSAASAPLSLTACPCSIWSGATVPGTPEDPDSLSVELGLKFRSDVSGYVTGVRFYKGPNNGGTHVGNLWTSTGSKLATATFINETGSGWQQAMFPNPVAIAAKTTYVVSYYAPAGRYSADEGFFLNRGVDAGVLHALTSGVDGPNGTYVYARGGGFPTSSYNATNYYVDVLFTADTSVPAGPVISAVTVKPATLTATVTWTTQVPATSRVDFGLSSSSLNLNVSDPSLVTSHSLTLPNLTPGLSYFLRVTSSDNSGNSATYPDASSTPLSFVTPTNLTWSISGAISPASISSGTAVMLTGTSSGTVTADALGRFVFQGLSNGMYTVTPANSGVVFTPASQNVTVAGGDVSGLAFTASTVTTTNPNLSVDVQTKFESIDGMGVNINVNSWNGGELKPALDYLTDVNGSSVFRVIRDPMTWVNDESLIPALHNLDPVVLQQVYEAPVMQDIWNTIGYLNQKGISGKQVLLNFMGWTPVWLGGSGQYGVASYITGGKEQSFATMAASLIYYGRTVRRLNFTYVGPLNESDWNCLEGPCVSPNQYVRIMRSLASELDYMGLTDIRFIAPDTAADPGSYISSIANDSVVFGRTDAFTNHTYGGTAVAGNYYPQKHYWITETGASCSSCDYAGTPSQGEWSFASQTNDNVIDDISSGEASVLVYDGYDSFYYHHNSFGYWGLLAFDTNSRVYTPRKRFYVNGQINKFIAPGSSRVGLTTSLGNLPHAAAIYNSTTGRITIVGHNSGSSPLKIDGQLVNGPVSSGVFHLFQTSQSVNFQQGADVTISGGQFSVTIPADTFFTLTN